MSRYSGNLDACPTCGLLYKDLRTGLDWYDVWLLFWNPEGTPSDEWPQKSRGCVLGRWFQIKQELWLQHQFECAAQAAFERGTAPGPERELTEEDYEFGG